MGEVEKSSRLRFVIDGGRRGVEVPALFHAGAGHRGAPSRPPNLLVSCANSGVRRAQRGLFVSPVSMAGPISGVVGLMGEPPFSGHEQNTPEEGALGLRLSPCPQPPKAAVRVACRRKLCWHRKEFRYRETHIDHRCGRVYAGWLRAF